HGLEARADRRPGLGRRPRQGLLRRAGRIQRRPRPHGQRRDPLRAADAARLCVLDRPRRGHLVGRAGLAAGAADRGAGRRRRARRARGPRRRGQRRAGLPMGLVRLLQRPGRQRLGPAAAACSQLAGAAARLFNHFTELVADASGWAYAIVFLLAYLDVFVPIVPSETAVITAGVVAGAGGLRLPGGVRVPAARALLRRTTPYPRRPRAGPPRAG